MTLCQEPKRSLSTVFLYYFKLWVSECGLKLGIPRNSFMSYQSIFRTLVYIFLSPLLIHWKNEERVILTNIPKIIDWPSVFLRRKVMRLRCHWTPSLFVHMTRNVYSLLRVSTLSWKTVLDLCLIFTKGNWSYGLQSIFRTLVYIFLSTLLIHWKNEERVILTNIPKISDWPSKAVLDLCLSFTKGNWSYGLRCQWEYDSDV